jgi:predicted regulator of Ras-like GTPase activity (Roadblock/LC7/MglB family)
VAGSPSWSLGEHDVSRIAAALGALREESDALHTLLIDRTGQVVASAGLAPDFDATTFASLAAADFAANEQLAGLLGGGDFASLSHQGARSSTLLAEVGEHAILAVIFDARVTLGMVRIRVRRALPALRDLVADALGRVSPGGGRPDLDAAWADEAEGEIDRLFGIR